MRCAAQVRITQTAALVVKSTLCHGRRRCNRHHNPCRWPGLKHLGIENVEHLHWCQLPTFKSSRWIGFSFRVGDEKCSLELSAWWRRFTYLCCISHLDSKQTTSWITAATRSVGPLVVLGYDRFCNASVNVKVKLRKPTKPITSTTTMKTIIITIMLYQEWAVRSDAFVHGGRLRRNAIGPWTSTGAWLQRTLLLENSTVWYLFS